MASAATKAVTRAPFPVGEKKVYLPNDLVALLRPKPTHSPYLASFRVPLTFNKLDLRDYLYHVYGLHVYDVRGYVYQPLVARRNQQQNWRGGQVYRPQPIKYMLAKLDRPFVWPAVPSADDKEARKKYDHDQFRRIQEAREEQTQLQKDKIRGDIAMRTEGVDVGGVARRRLAEEARALLAGEKAWENKLELDPIWLKDEMPEEGLRDVTDDFGERGSPWLEDKGGLDVVDEDAVAWKKR